MFLKQALNQDMFSVMAMLLTSKQQKNLQNPCLTLFGHLLRKPVTKKNENNPPKPMKPACYT